MTHRRVRHVCAAAAAFAVVALLPGSAAAHPADCDDTVLNRAPAAERFADWGTGSACASWGARSAGDDSAGVARVSSRSTDKKRGSLRQVGHEPLLSRGMNAAIAVHEDYAYIGSRTDGGHGAPQGGIMVVDISDPSDPDLLGHAVRREGRRVDARAARLAVAGRPDRAQHELRRRPDTAPLHAAVDQQHPLLRHRGPEREAPAAAQPVRRRHARVLPVGGPEGSRAGADLRRQRQLDVRDAGRRAELPVLGLGHLEGARRRGAGRRSTAGCTPTAASRRRPSPRRSRPAACTRSRSATTAAGRTSRC